MEQNDDARKREEEKYEKEWEARNGVTYSEHLEISRLAREIRAYVSIEDKKKRLKELVDKQNAALERMEVSLR